MAAQQGPPPLEESEKEPRRQDLYFTVQETHGASLPPIMHPRQPHAVAYATGPFIVIWDWKSDHKQLLRHHRLAVTSICFSPSGCKLVSADAEKVLVWNSISWELIESAMRPVGRTGEFEPGEEDAAAAVGRISSMAAAATTVAAAQRFKRLLASGEQRNGGMWRVRADENGSDGNKPTRITKMRFLDGDRSLVSLEQCPDMKALQSLRIWQLEEESGIMASAERGLDQDAVHSLCTQQKGLSIYTCSNGELSAWTCHDKAYGDRFGNMARLWRVECEELDGDFVDVTVSSTMGWVMVPISHGKLLILDEHGNKLRTVVRDDTVFTSACMGGRECLLVGTSKGTILWFNVPSLDVWRRMPYDLALRDSVDAARAASAVALQAWSESSPDSGINGVRVTALSGNGGLCMRYTADQTIAVVDLETGNVCNASFGHLKDVTSLCSAISTRPGNVCLYTGSLDETVGIWELDGTKVECSHQRFLDIPSNIHPSLTYRRGLMIAPGNSQGRGNLLLGGDKPTGSAADVNGNAGLADDKRIGTNNALLTQKGTGTQADKAEGPRPSGSSSFSVQCIAVDSVRGLLACGTSHGCCMIFDWRTNKLRFCIDVCRTRVSGLAFVKGGNYLVARSAQGWVWVLDSITGFKKTMTVQEPDKLRDSNSYVWPCHKVLVVDHVSEKDDRDAAERSQAAIISSFQVATLLTPNTIALYLVDAFKFGGSTFTPDSVKQPATTVATISLEASPVDFELHPSHNYIYLLSEAGLVHVKHVKPAGDPARGGLEALPTLEADQGYTGTCIALDPSGLYLVTACTAPNRSASTLCLWEAATGELVDCVRHLPPIRTLCFLYNGRGIVAGCYGGPVVFLKLPLELTRDSSYVLLGGPHSATQGLLETLSMNNLAKVSFLNTLDPERNAKAPEASRSRPAPPSSGMERHERCATVPDLIARVVPGTSGSSVQNVWADKPIWLPEMLPFPDELIGDPPKKDEEVGK